MPKMKTKKAVASRLKVTATGKLKKKRAGMRHLLSHKSSKRKRQLGKPGLVDKGWEKMYKRLIGA